MLPPRLGPEEAHDAGRDPVKSRPYRNSLACFRGVWRSEGVGGFFLGIRPNLVRSFGGAVLLVGYDVIKGMIGPT